MNTSLPLSGILVVDATRLLPGAILARQLIDLGARLIKIEEPRMGDPLRFAPPLIDGVGAGFCSFFRGAQSVTLDLRTSPGVESLHKLLVHADIFIEGFRPGTLARWGIDYASLQAKNKGLISCSLPAFSKQSSSGQPSVGHDLNFIAMTGLLAQLPGDGIPSLQFADISAGLLACSSILAALVQRGRTGAGCALTQPLITGPLPFLLWAWADTQMGGPSMTQTILAGRCPAYRVYTCAEESKLAVACFEPKFWQFFIKTLGLPELAGDALDCGTRGQAAIVKIQAHLHLHPCSHWLALLQEFDLPISAVHSMDAAQSVWSSQDQCLFEQTPLPDGSQQRFLGPLLACGQTPQTPAPRLGQHTQSVLSEFGVSKC